MRGWHISSESACSRELPAPPTADEIADYEEARNRLDLSGYPGYAGTVEGEPWESTASFDVPGGYVQWTRVDNSGVEVHLEVSDKSDFAQPLTSEFADRLVMLGWNAPEGDFRNCWTRFDLAASARDLIGGALSPANDVVLAATIGLGNEIDVLAERIDATE